MALSRIERQILVGLAVSAVVAAVLHEVLELKEIGDAIQLQILEDHYALLGVKETASETEINIAYKRQTSSFHSKLTTEEGRMKRAKLVTAYEILTSEAARKAYDSRRQFIASVTNAFSAACIILPSLGAFYILWKSLSYWMKNTGYCVDPSSFEGKVVSTFKKVRAHVPIELHKPADEKLGVDLASTNDGKLKVQAIFPGSFVDTYNESIRAAESQKHDDFQFSDWQSKAIREKDIIVSVNGVSDPAHIGGAFGSATTLTLVIMRSFESFFPWVCEAEVRKSSPEERWGCQMGVAPDGSDTMEVHGVDPSGALERWNNENPRRRICVGDRIAAVGRAFGSAQMLARLQDSSVTSSTWVFFRGVHAGDRLPEVASGPLRKQVGEKLGIRIGSVLESPIRGSIVEVGEGSAVIVKEVVSGYLVDKWNKAHAQPVFEGATVLAVNGNTNPSEFAGELGKPSVTLRTRPPRGITIKMCTERPEATPKALNLADSSQRSSRPSRLPRCCRPKCFETRLREMLTLVRCEFLVEICRAQDGDGSGPRVGLQLDKEREVGGFTVLSVQSDGLVAAYNSATGGRHRPTVRPGDILIGVNESSALSTMVETLSNAAVEKLALRFSRKPADAAPGIWEATVERAPGEGWGVQLTEQPLVRGPSGCGPLVVEAVAENMAIDRWNQQAPSTTWPVKVGDLIVGCEDEVGHDNVLAKLKESHRVRLTLLRWHAGPAPGVEDEEWTHYQVVLQKAEPSDKLGIVLGPCSKNRTRTVLTMIKEGGLVDQHNRRCFSGKCCSETDNCVVRVGDEVRAVNGQLDSSRFAEACGASRVELDCRRRPGGGEAENNAVAAGSAGQPRFHNQHVSSHTEHARSKTDAPNPLPRATEQPVPEGAEGAETVRCMREHGESRASATTKSNLEGATEGAAVATSSVIESETLISPDKPANACENVADVAGTDNVTVADLSEPASLPAKQGPDEKIAKENFLLKVEVAQLKSQLSEERAKIKEFQQVKAELDALRDERGTLQSELIRLQRMSDSWQQKAEGHEAVFSQVSELRAQELRRLQDLSASLGHSLSSVDDVRPADPDVQDL